MTDTYKYASYRVRRPVMIYPHTRHNMSGVTGFSVNYRRLAGSIEKFWMVTLMVYGVWN